MGINLYTHGLKAQINPLNGASSAVISSINNPFSLLDIDQNYSTVKIVLNLNHQNISVIILIILKVQK